jgi:hypothetical protein
MAIVSALRLRSPRKAATQWERTLRLNQSGVVPEGRRIAAAISQNVCAGVLAPPPELFSLSVTSTCKVFFNITLSHILDAPCNIVDATNHDVDAGRDRKDLGGEHCLPRACRIQAESGYRYLEQAICEGCASP